MVLQRWTRRLGLTIAVSAALQLGFVAGATVVDIGDIRIARGFTRRHHTSCSHRKMMYDTHERRIWCKDCAHDVEPFDAFVALVGQHDDAVKILQRRQTQLAEAEAHKVRSLAAREIDKAWQSRTTVPACPHCSHGLFPEDFKNGVFASLGREYAEALAKRRRAEKPEK